MLDRDPLADQDLRVPAADRREPDEALLVDVGDREPDLVDVADDRDQRLRVLARHPRDRRADPVGVSSANDAASRQTAAAGAS